MNYKRIYAAASPQRPPEPPTPRLIAMRRTSSLCIENEAIWYQHHDWRIGGTCGRCGIKLKEAA